MSYRVVVPHDYGPEADLALTWAASLVRSAGGTLVLLHVILVPAPPIPKMPMIAALRPTEDPEQSGEKLREKGAALGVPMEVDVFETNEAGVGIVERAKALRAGLIAMGVSVPGRGGLARAFLGSVVDHVVWNASCPVVVVRPGTDGS